MIIKQDWSKLQDTVGDLSIQHALWYMTDQDECGPRYPVPALYGAYPDHEWLTLMAIRAYLTQRLRDLRGDTIN